MVDKGIPTPNIDEVETKTVCNVIEPDRQTQKKTAVRYAAIIKLDRASFRFTIATSSQLFAMCISVEPRNQNTDLMLCVCSPTAVKCMPKILEITRRSSEDQARETCFQFIGES